MLHPPVAGSCFGSARRLHVTALRGHCESHEGAVLVASSAVYDGAAPEKKPAGRLSSRLRSQLESRAVWSKPRLERDHSAAFSARTALQRCKHARATCVRLPDLSSRFSRVPPKEPRSPRWHVPSDPSSVRPQKPGRAEASHASALSSLRAVISTPGARIACRIAAGRSYTYGTVSQSVNTGM